MKRIESIQFLNSEEFPLMPKIPRLIKAEPYPPPVEDIYEARAQISRLINEKGLLMRMIEKEAANGP